MISLDDFRQSDLRIGEVIAAQPIPGSSRLLKVQVSLGEEQRVLVAGLARHYRPDALVGTKVVVLVNLEPATIHGVQSEGMLLGVGCAGTPALLTVTQPVPNGSRVE